MRLVPVILALALASAAAADLRHDPAHTLAGLDRFDGSVSAPPTTTGLWRQLAFELRRDAAIDPGWPAPRDLQHRALASVGADVVPVGLLHADYDLLSEGALLDDPSTRDGTPARAFAACALRPAVHRGGRITFEVSPSWTLGTFPSRLELDAADGLGWRTVTPDGRLDASYAATGTVTIRLRTDDGLHAAFPLEIAALAAPAPHDTLHVTATETWDGAAATGDAYVYLAPGRTALQNPVIVVEGFDLDDTMDWDVLYEVLNTENLIEDLRADGFDAVVLDFDTATAPIQRNGLLVAELVQQVNAMLPAHRTTTLIGASMGGLVTRWALGWMQEQGIDHRVRTWVAFDSPQRGAVIPLGLQHWLEFFQGESEDAAYLLSRLDTPAARQMLLHHHGSTSGTSAAPDPAFGTFFADLAARPLPDCRRVAVANGSGTAVSQGFGPGAQLIRYEYRSLLVDITGNVWALPDGPTIRIFEGEQNLIWPLPDTYLDVNVGGTLPWDGAPGGRRASMAQMDTTSVPYGDIEALADNHCFIPTISSLDLDVTDPFHGVSADPDLMSRTSFHALYVPAENQDHIAVTAESAPWFLQEVRDGVVAVDDPLPARAATLVAHPNPFNPRTTVSFLNTADGPVRVEAFDLRGRKVATLLDDTRPAGIVRIEWDGRADSGTSLPSGTYLLRLQAPDTERTLPVSLLE